ncbi:hypothetical protein C1Y31_31650 [Pseudomonas sp. FW305-25]|nr:hypothetical protein C1Y31_31650 [Pseudomonas sp. FW305-25]PMY60290.1 hypothetical protein C1Y32_31585 [Pseudomonas sp. FW126-L8]PNA69044.1 hypothetical protein C1Y33_31585 [Pseudomonas sp. FW305-76]
MFWCCIFWVVHTAVTASTFAGFCRSSRSTLDCSRWRRLWLCIFWTVYISISAVMAAGGFALTASPFLQTPKKEPKTLCGMTHPHR